MDVPIGTIGQNARPAAFSRRPADHSVCESSESACHKAAGVLISVASRSFPMQVLLLDKGNGKALFRRGKARRQLGQLEEALQDLQAAARLGPEDAATRRELVALQREQHAQQKAVAGMFRGWARPVPGPSVAPQADTPAGGSGATLARYVMSIWHAFCRRIRGLLAQH